MSTHFIPQLQQVSVAAAQQALQVELMWAILIAVGLVLVGAFIGTSIGFLITGRDMKLARSDAVKMRDMRDLAETAHSLALTERERAVRELQEKQQQLDEAQLALQQHAESVRQKLADNEQMLAEQQATINQLRAELVEAQTRLSDCRARVIEADHATAEMHDALQSMESLLQLQRARLSYSALNSDAPADAVPLSRDQRLEQMQAQLDAILQRITPAPAAPADAPTAPEPDTLGLPVPAEELRLEDVKGIGAGYAERLRAGGINNVADLAAAAPEQLAGIIKAPGWRKPNYADWIKTAQKLKRT